MKKSTLKKALAIMLALVLTFAISVPAFAATAGSGYTITITPGNYTDTSKTDRYKAYEIFTGRLTQPEEDTNDDKKIDEKDLTDYEKNQLADIKWGEDVDVTKLVEALTAADSAFGNAFDAIKTLSGDAQASKVAEILSEKGTVSDEDKTDADKVAAAEAFAKAFAIAAKASLKNPGAKPVSSSYNGSTFSIVVKNPGYYLIVDDPSDEPEVAKGDIISEHILQVVRDRSVKVKSDTPTVDKEIVTGNGGYEIGETITFRLTGTLAENFRNFVGDYYYAFVDTMTDGLTLDKTSIQVEVWTVKEDGSLDKVVNTIELTEDEEYTVTVTTATTGETAIKIEFENLKDIEGLKAEHVIVVTYNACINDKAIIGEPEINTVKLEFSNDPYTQDSTTETPEKIKVVETFEIDIIKSDSVTNEGLEGVEFILYYVDPGEDPVSTDDDTIYYGKLSDDGNGTYTLLEKNGWTTTKDNATKLVTVENGVLNIKGLGIGTYYLEESVYNGYNALAGPIEITISVDAYYTAEDEAVKQGTVKAGEVKSVSATVKVNGEESVLAEIDTTRTPAVVGKIPLNVKNVPASSLPSTGGIGNYVFYIGGVLLIAVAVVGLIISKKKSSVNEAE